jgi:hypothetical protein
VGTFYLLYGLVSFKQTALPFIDTSNDFGKSAHALPPLRLSSSFLVQTCHILSQFFTPQPEALFLFISKLVMSRRVEFSCSGVWNPEDALATRFFTNRNNNRLQDNSESCYLRIGLKVCDHTEDEAQ